MSEKNSFVMLKEWKEQIAYLSESEKAALLDCIFAYQSGEELTDSGDPLLDVVFSMMRRFFDNCDEKYRSTSETNAANGAKGGAPKGNQNARKQPKTTENNRKQPTETTKTTETTETSLSEYDSEYDSEHDTEYDSESEHESEIDKKEKGPKGPKKKKFVPPDVCEVEAYITDKGYSVSASAFIDYYTANGWMVGRNKMKDWKAAVRTWNGRNSNAPPGKVCSGKSFSELADEMVGGDLF